MKKTLLAAAVAALTTFAGGAHASVIAMVVEGGGTQRVYQLANGNFLGLWGFDNREAANPGRGAVTISAASQIIARFSGGAARIVGFYNGANPVNPGARQFTPVTFGFTIADNARVSNAIWIEWRSGNLVYHQPTRGTATMAARATLAGDPLTPVPVPAALPLLLAGMGALAFAARRRKAA